MADQDSSQTPSPARKSRDVTPSRGRQDSALRPVKSAPHALTDAMPAGMSTMKQDGATTRPGVSVRSALPAMPAPVLSSASPAASAAHTRLEQQLAEHGHRLAALEQALIGHNVAEEASAAPTAGPVQAPPPEPFRARFIKRTARGLARTVFSFPLEPLQDIERRGSDRNGFRCSGIQPQFALGNPEPRLPYGWVKIRTRFVPQKDAVMNLRLYLDTGAGFQPADCYALPMPNNAQGDICDIRFIPPTLHQMRLDVVTSTGQETFELDALSVQEMTKQEALAELVLRAAQERNIPAHRWPHAFGKLIRKLRTVGITGCLALLQRRGEQSNQRYADWVRTYDTLNDLDRLAIKIHMAKFKSLPRISVIMPVYNPPVAYLKRAIESVQAQLYDNWELCIANDASSFSYVAPLLDALAAQDSRIRVIHRSQQGHICKATNDALDLATGEYVAFLDHDDELREHALYLLAETIQRHPETQLIYSDEDKIDAEGNRYDPYFKSSWNPDLLRAQNYINHLSCYKRSLVREIGGLRTGYEGSQDYDLVLRATAKLEDAEIRHIPHVLYLWRAIEGSTAHTPQAKPYTFQAAKQALTDDIERRGEAAEVVLRPDGFFRTRYALPKRPPLVSIIIPTRDHVALLRQCMQSIATLSTYSRYEIIIVDNDSAKPETHAYFASLAKDPRIRILPYLKVFNYAAINNAAVAQAGGDVVCLLNNDIEIITPDWLEELVSQAMRPEIGAVGAKLYYPDRSLQHAGVVLGVGGIAGHAHKHLPGQDPGTFSRANLVQNFAAVTGACLAIRRETYLQVGGLDEALRVAYNDVDFCLRVRAQGLRNLWTPYVEMFHHESASRGTDFTPAKLARANQESALMRQRWDSLLQDDPYYNPNLTLVMEDFSLALPPRAVKPWQVSQASRPGA